MKPPFPVSPLHRCLRGLSLAPLLLVCSQAVWAVQTTPTNDFIDNGDGTVTHKTTGLMWMRCSMGQTWDGTTCTGTANTYAWGTAAAFKGAYAGYNDWRLPNMPELTSIVENDNASPAINTTLFPNTPTNNWYWSSSPLAASSNDHAWLIDFGDGSNRWYYKTNGYYVRLVRGGQLFGSLPLTTPSADFVDNDDGTVTHKRTNLTWMRCAVGQSWDQASAACTASASGFTHFQAQTYSHIYAGYGDWRLPNQNELQTIIEYGKFGPALNAALFPGDNGSYPYWSSNESGGSDGRGVSFDYGKTYTASRYTPYRIRMVRGSTPGSVGEDKQNIVLFLHGMNSKPATWNEAVTGYFNNCPSIYDGKIGSTARANVQKTFCYRLKFGAFDWASADMGLEDAWDYGEINGYASAGDFSTFDQLGIEISRAVNAIKNKYPNPKILLVAHSRGGLAARAFLQNTTQHRNAIVGLITTGTPHKGSRLGRIYSYIASAMLAPDGSRIEGDTNITNDWEVVDTVNGSNGGEFGLDARRPVINYLADNSQMIADLNKAVDKLPAIKYGELTYTNTVLGVLKDVKKLGIPFTYGLFHDNAIVDGGPQLSLAPEGYIKGWVKGFFSVKPKPSKTYMGDGIVAVDDQKILPNARHTPKPYKNVYHMDETERAAEIAEMICGLGFNWIKTCPPAAQVALAQRALAPFKPAETVSHDYDTLLADKTQTLWQDWLKVMADDTQTNRREQLAVALSIKLRNTDNAALLTDIKQHQSEPNATALERARLAQLLAEIATPSALDVLVEAYINNDSQFFKDCHSCAKALSNAIKTVADSLPEQPRRADLSAVLEAAWLQPRLSQLQLNTLADAIAKLGTSRGVELLLAAVEKNGAVLPSMQKKALSRTEKQAVAAFLAMGEIINPDSETVLTTAFMNHRANSAVFVSAGQGLVNLGSTDAAQKVLQRVDELPANALPVGKRWLGQLAGKVDKASLRRINKAVGSPKQPVLKLQMEDMVK